MRSMGRRREAEAGLVALLAGADGACRGVRAGAGGVGWGADHLSQRAYLYPYSVAGFLRCQQKVKN